MNKPTVCKEETDGLQNTIRLDGKYLENTDNTLVLTIFKG